MWQAFGRMDYAIHPAGVHFTMRLTYRTPPYDDDSEGTYVTVEDSESHDNSENVVRVKTLWDDDCPWAEWYSADDPIKGAAHPQDHLHCDQNLLPRLLRNENIV